MYTENWWNKVNSNGILWSASAGVWHWERYVCTALMNIRHTQCRPTPLTAITDEKCYWTEWRRQSTSIKFFGVSRVRRLCVCWATVFTAFCCCCGDCGCGCCWPYLCCAKGMKEIKLICFKLWSATAECAASTRCMCSECYFNNLC